MNQHLSQIQPTDKHQVKRWAKTILADVFGATGLTRFLISAQRWFVRGGYIRAVNYHGTRACTAMNFERQLGFLASEFVGVSLADLGELFQSGCWQKSRPGLILSFDDGLASNYSVAAPLLEKYGFTGWFFVPMDFVDCPVSGQAQFALNSGILRKGDAGDSHHDGRIALSRQELADLVRRNHVVGCHTRTHCRTSRDLPNEVLHYEIESGKRAVGEATRRECDCYAWVGGETWAYSAAAASVIRDAGYKYAFMTNSLPITGRSDPHHLQRNNVEADWSLALVSFELCGVQDLRYILKRRRVNRVTANDTLQ